MEDILETYDIQTIEQLRAIADPLRTRIYEALAVKPMTATQVGEELDEPAPKAHYHVRELERVGLVRLVETRERGGILEKYYRAIARGLRVPPSLFQQAPPDEVASAMDSFLYSVVAGFKTTVSRLIASKAPDFNASMLTLSSDSLWMTPEEYQRTLKAALELFKPYYQRRGVEGEREISLTVISYDARLGRPESDGDGALASGAPPTPVASPIPPIPPAPISPQSPALRTDTGGPAKSSSGKPRKVVVAGAVSYSRRSLQEMADRGERLDLNVIGYLSFADDVPADLARRVIHRLSYRGVLTAPAEVREALREKEE